MAMHNMKGRITYEPNSCGSLDEPREDSAVGFYAAVADRTQDAFEQLKFIGYIEAAMPLFQRADIAKAFDQACVELDGSKSIEDFITACRKLRFWKREEAVSF